MCLGGPNKQGCPQSVIEIFLTQAWTDTEQGEFTTHNPIIEIIKQSSWVAVNWLS